MLEIIEQLNGVIAMAAGGGLVALVSYAKIRLTGCSRQKYTERVMAKRVAAYERNQK